MGLRIEGKQLCHRFLFFIFHFSASLRNTCSSVPLQAKEIFKKTTEKRKKTNSKYRSSFRRNEQTRKDLCLSLGASPLAEPIRASPPSVRLRSLFGTAVSNGSSARVPLRCPSIRNSVNAPRSSTHAFTNSVKGKKLLLPQT